MHASQGFVRELSARKPSISGQSSVADLFDAMIRLAKVGPILL